MFSRFFLNFRALVWGNFVGIILCYKIFSECHRVQVRFSRCDSRDDIGGAANCAQAPVRGALPVHSSYGFEVVPTYSEIACVTTFFTSMCARKVLCSYCLSLLCFHRHEARTRRVTPDSSPASFNCLVWQTALLLSSNTFNTTAISYDFSSW